MKRKSFDPHLYALITNRSNSSERTFKSYTLLLWLVPHLKDMLNDSTVDNDTFDSFLSQVPYLSLSYVSVSHTPSLQLQKGANDARSDDVRRIKEELANWINQTFSPTTPLGLKQRDDRGLQNDVTGRLLCPIEHSWDDDE